jgi:hypothetical protein
LPIKAWSKRNAVDTYFDYLKKAVSSTPSGGTEFGEKLKSYADANLSTTSARRSAPSASSLGVQGFS